FWQAFMTFVGGDHRRAPQIIDSLFTDSTDKRLQSEARRLVSECRRIERDEAAYYAFIARAKAGSAKGNTADREEALTWERAASGPRLLPETKKQAILLPSFPIGHLGPDTEARVEPLRQLIASHSDSPHLLSEAGVLLAAAGALPDSLSCFEQILSNDEAHPQARLAQARLLQATGAHERLQQELAKAVSLQPGHAGLQTAYALALMRWGDPWRGYLESRQALQLGSEAPELRLVRAEFFLALGRLPEARREVDLAKTCDDLPRDLQTHLNLIQLQLDASMP
ncbi:MAG TPA: hypothetical protein PKO06_23830, partial [Candidatus Ozemobacteraceae bacterium]|nr:hypothetical protein [Candidatus Ozemobacteraceae bacterium]